jgi:co-chaperonin GroES (HSP10)|tara:strand:+ start:281 stop:571 length:291 start_codon:yes stop_codon:yes gene_type:complete
MEKSNINFKPIGEKILVDVHPFETEINGIIRVDHLQQNHKGTVVATNTDVPIYLNDVVVYAPTAGVPVTVDEKEYQLLRVDEIFGVIDSEFERVHN